MTTSELIFIVVAIVLMIVAISKWKIHPFLAIMAASIVIACQTVDGVKIVPTISAGFSSIMASIGLVIILGTIIGLILEKTGAAVQLANTIIKYLGKKYPQLAIMLIGWVISIPVFCDSGFVIVNPIRKWLSKKSGYSSVTLTVALSAGLYIAHTFIPPTPGPVAAAGFLGIDNNLLLVIGLGTLISIPALVAAFFYATYIGKRVKSSEELDVEAVMESYSEHNLPGFWASVTPILVPILLMSFSTVGNAAGGGKFGVMLNFIGSPIMALTVGLICAIPLLRKNVGLSQLYDITQEALKVAGPIVFITAAGGVLGKVITEAGFVEYIKVNAPALSSLGLLFPFLIAAILKTAQGSSTVAMTTTAGIMGLYFADSGSLMATMEMTTPIEAAMTVIAIGAGAMTVSHANDSYFWVVTNFGGLSAKNGYKTQTMVTLIMGVVSICSLLLLSVFV